MNRALIVIPTRNRPPDVLLDVLTACRRCSGPEGADILLVDNNDESLSVSPALWDERIFNSGPKKSDAEAQQIGLDYAKEHGYPVVVKWDDDLLPLGLCLHHLIDAVGCEGFTAAGGCYPTQGDDRRVTFFAGAPMVPDGQGRHLQFFEWKGQDRSYPIHHLYSSFAYRVEAAEEVGGWCTNYSRLSYRHETDFTLRLNALPNSELAILPYAIAVHLRAGTTGGTQSIPLKQASRMRTADQQLFEQRMAERGIDPNY